MLGGPGVGRYASYRGGVCSAEMQQQTLTASRQVDAALAARRRSADTAPDPAPDVQSHSPAGTGPLRPPTLSTRRRTSPYWTTPSSRPACRDRRLVNRPWWCNRCNAMQCNVQVSTCGWLWTVTLPTSRPRRPCTAPVAWRGGARLPWETRRGGDCGDTC